MKKTRFKPIFDYFDYFFLDFLSKGPSNNKTILELRDILNVAHKNLLAHIKKLEGMGLIIRDEKTLKGRSTLIKITSEGKKAHQILHKIFKNQITNKKK
ncbi:transcriptional regulator [archaeon]|nr:transcriptional regulator [archaeon]